MNLRCTLEAQSPLVISARRATGNSIETVSLIPGSVVRGALAQSYLFAGGEAGDEDFQNLFLRDLIHFGDLRVDGARPWPLSSRLCVDREDEHEPIDLLLPAAAQIPIPFDCQSTDSGSGGPEAVCGAKRDYRHGYYLDTRNGYRAAQVTTRRVAHTAIDPHYLRARSEQFHSSRVVCDGQQFQGGIRARDAGLEALQRLFRENRRTVFVGRGRSRGQGRALLRLDVASHDDVSQLKRRIEALNRKAAEFPALLSQIVFSCTLLSPAILLDEWLFSRPALTAEDILGDSNAYDLKSKFHRCVPIAGWNAAAGFPKPEVAAIAAGSCFLFARACPAADRDAAYADLASRLAVVAGEGIGERREEGFGEIAFCEEFHERAALEIQQP